MTDRSPETLVDALTLAEQVALMSGADLWSLPPIPRLEIGSLVVTDGPNGARGGGALTGGVKAAAFPVGIALGATWDVALLHRIGAALAQETRDKGAHALLAPTVNLQRGALNGRNFECYSEDPVLTAHLAVAYIRGLQDNGVAATVKHFVGNESEIRRRTMSSDIDERTLREMYLVPFEAAVKEAGTWAVMSSYNRLNGTWTSEHPWLLTEVLRDDWGFDGVVISDWFGSQGTIDSALAGLDLEMPGPTRDRGAKLVAAVEAGQVGRDVVRRAALNVLRLMARTGAIDSTGPRVERAEDRAETRALIRRAGAAGAVLLQNDGVLPLSGSPKVALIGPNAAMARTMGGGSAQLNAHRQVSIYDSLVEAMGQDRVTLAPGCTNHKFRPVIEGPLEVEWFDNPDLSGAPVHRATLPVSATFLMGELAGGRIDPDAPYSLRVTGRFVPTADGTHEVGIHAAGRARVRLDGVIVVDAWDDWTAGTTFFEQGCDERVAMVDLRRGVPVDVAVEFRSARVRGLGLQGFHAGTGRPMGDAEIAEAARLAGNADVAIVCVGRTAEWDSEGADLPDMTLPGRQDDLVRAVAAAARRTVVVLQTGGPVEMPWAGDVSAILQAWYPGQEAGPSIADVLTGAAEPGGRLPQSFPVHAADMPTAGQGAAVYPGKDGHVRYAEGLFTGYRHHARAGIAPLFAFGHGMGYADIGIKAMQLDEAEFETDGRVGVTVTLANRSDRAGAQIVQVYVSPEGAPVERPEAELKGFARIELGAGQRGTVRVDLTARDFAWFDCGRQGWVVSAGRYRIRAALSAADGGFGASVTRRSETILRK